MLIDDIKPYLCCPDDGRPISIRSGRIVCLGCGREYSILAENFIEMLPSKFPAWELQDGAPKGAEQMSIEEFHKEFEWEPKSSGWGDLSSASQGYRAFYQAQGMAIYEGLNPQGTEIAIDVSGAVGNHSVALADKVRVMVNCDLHGPSILTAYQRRKENMICVRAPYLRLPFYSGTFDYAICTDTLIRGRTHEVKLLREITRILKPGGKAVVDFHNRRLGSSSNAISLAYSLGEVKSILHEAGIGKHEIFPFAHIPLRFVPTERLYGLMDVFARIFLDGARHMVLFTK